jgi:hypothetical protein
MKNIEAVEGEAVQNVEADPAGVDPAHHGGVEVDDEVKPTH